jgi:hypothetical protein
MTGAGPSDIAAAGAGLPPPAILGATLDLCDGMLGEIGRRDHRFGWLRSPAGDDWLKVDGYYPGNHVVVCIALDAEQERLCRELVPRHGLYLLILDASDLDGDRRETVDAIAATLRRAGWTPRPLGAPVMAAPAPPPPADAAPRPGRPAPTQAAAAAGARMPARGRNPPTTDQEERFGIVVGLALIAVVWVEAYLGVVVLAVNHDHIVLGVGLVLDACARVLGTVAAGHAGRHDEAWACLAIGSPVVAAYTVGGDDGAAGSERAPLPAIVARAALGVLAAGVLLALIGG